MGKLADPPPASLVQYVECHMEFGGAAASAQLCTYDIVIPPQPVRHIISGSREQALVPRDEELSRFLASLFDRVRERGSEVQLASWDLYHGHAFLYVEPGADATGAKVDLGILFHAKEYPKEYRMTKYGPTYPIGAPEMGGEKDPRRGTTFSVGDSSFPLRNSLWLLSRNEIFELDPREESFPQDSLDDQEFYTVNASRLGSLDPVFDVNYFPWLAPPSLLLAPRDGFPISLKVSQEIQGGNLGLPEAIGLALSRVDSSGLRSLSPLVAEQPEGHPALVEMIPVEARGVVRGAIAVRIEKLDKERAAHNAKERVKLRKEVEGLDEALAEEMLELSQSHDQTFSAFRAANLLPVLRPEHRTPAQIERFGTAVADHEVARQVWKVAFYTDNTLQALSMIAEDPSLTPKAAAEAVVAVTEAETRRAFAEQQQAAQAKRQADADAAARQAAAARL